MLIYDVVHSLEWTRMLSDLQLFSASLVNGNR